MPKVLDQKVSALKVNELWKTMDGDFSGYIKLDEFSSNKILGNTEGLVKMLKGMADTAPEVLAATEAPPKPASPATEAPKMNTTNTAPLEEAGGGGAEKSAPEKRPESANTTSTKAVSGS